MFPILPWCRLERAYRIGNVEIVPYSGHLDGADDATQDLLRRVLGTYRNIVGRPVDRAAVVRYAGTPFGQDLASDILGELYEAVTLACFASLAGRRFFTPEATANSDVFGLFIQRLADPELIALRTRRRDGHTWSLWPREDVVVTVPVHVSPVRSVAIDAPLLEALVKRSRLGDADWGRWQHAIGCFNQGNTDSDAVSYQVEWGLMCSAFERLLDAAPSAVDVATKFTETIRPQSTRIARDGPRAPERWKGADASLRFEWLREFYRVRGDFAHGRLDTRQPMAWEPLEHLTLAAIGFPLLVRCLLRAASLYELTDDDRAGVDAFESFADQPRFLEPPPGSARGSIDTWWARLYQAARLGHTG